MAARDVRVDGNKDFRQKVESRKCERARRAIGLKMKGNRLEKLH
jgi:hypothetical protein